MAEPTPTVVYLAEPLLIDDDGAARLLGVGRSHFRQMLRAGQIGPEPVRLGRRQLHRVDLLREFVAAGLPDRATWLQMKGGGADG